MKKLLVLSSVCLGFIGGILLWIITKDLAKFYLNNLTTFGVLSGWAGAIASTFAAIVALWVAIRPKEKYEMYIDSYISYINWYQSFDDPDYVQLPYLSKIELKMKINIVNIGNVDDVILGCGIDFKKGRGSQQMVGGLYKPIISSNHIFIDCIDNDDESFSWSVVHDKKIDKDVLPHLDDLIGDGVERWQADLASEEIRNERFPINDGEFPKHIAENIDGIYVDFIKGKGRFYN